MSNIESISDSIRNLRKGSVPHETPKPKFAPKQIVIEEPSAREDERELVSSDHELADASPQDVDPGNITNKDAQEEEEFKPRFGRLKNTSFLKNRKTAPLESVFDKYVCRQVRVSKSDWECLDDLAEDLQFIKSRNRSSSKNRITTNTIMRAVAAEFIKKLEAYDRDISYVKSEEDVRTLVKSILNNR